MVGRLKNQNYPVAPNGLPIGNKDPIMVLGKWATFLEGQGRRIIRAGMGNPSYPLNPNLLSNIRDELEEERDRALGTRVFLKAEGINDTDRINNIAELNAVLDYADPQGTSSARTAAAKALSKWYGAPITKENILFTTGGAGGLYDIFIMLNEKCPQGRIVTPFPHYSLYATIGSRMNNLHPIHVMQENGYRLTAKALRASIEDAKKKAMKDGHPISAFLFCDPNNPLGTVISEQEWIEIAEVLREAIKEFPGVPIIIDAAYAGMVFPPHQPASLLKVADEELRKNILLLHSGTKTASASGLRGAVVVAFDKTLLTRIEQTNIDTTGHSVTIIQEAVAKSFDTINDAQERQYFVEHYQPQVELVYKRFNAMKAAMPNPAYKPQGTFYVLGDFSDFLGTELCEEAQAVVGKKPFITSDEDLCYDLLFRDGVMIAPMEYYGLDGSKKAYMRVTCSGGIKVLNELMDILAARLLEARKTKIDSLLKENKELLTKLNTTNAPADEISVIQRIIEDIEALKFDIIDVDAKAAAAKQPLETLKELRVKLNTLLITYDASTKEGYQSKLLKMENAFATAHLARETKKTIKTVVVKNEIVFRVGKSICVLLQSLFKTPDVNVPLKIL